MNNLVFTPSFHRPKAPPLPATLIFKRDDGHELSLSSDNNNMCEFSGGTRIVKNHGCVDDASKFLKIVTAFLAPTQ